MMPMTDFILDLALEKARSLYALLEQRKESSSDEEQILTISVFLREAYALGWELRSEEIYKSPYEYCICSTHMIDKLNSLASCGWEPIMIDDSRIVMRRRKVETKEGKND